MKRMLMAVAVALIAAVGSGRADPGGYAPPGGRQAGYQLPPASAEFSAQGTLMGVGASAPGRAPERYGLLPGLRKAFRLGGSSCSTCGHSEHIRSGGGGYAPPPANPPVMQGTLVFPHHPYVRSPRDFFMYEPGR